MMWSSRKLIKQKRGLEVFLEAKDPVADGNVGNKHEERDHKEEEEERKEEAKMKNNKTKGASQL